MKKRKENSILWVEGIAFSMLIVLSWMTELLRFPNLLFGDPFNPNWHRAVVRSLVIMLVWAWVHVATKRLLKRLHHLEDFLRICGWCRRVCHEGQWLPLEKYFSSRFATTTTHGMCPDCLKQKVEEINATKPAPDNSSGN